MGTIPFDSLYSHPPLPPYWQPPSQQAMVTSPFLLPRSPRDARDFPIIALPFSSLIVLISVGLKGLFT